MKLRGKLLMYDVKKVKLFNAFSCVDHHKR